MKQRLSPLQRMKALGPYKPSFRVSFRLPGNPRNGFTQSLPLQRSWPAATFVAVMAGIFFIPLFSMDFSFGETEDLFDLTTNLFMLFWAMGWSLGVLVLVLVLLAFLFGREVLIVEPEGIRLRMEIFNIGLESRNPLPALSNLRYVTDNIDTGSQWRGKHLCVDYLHVPVAFGSDLDRTRAERLMQRINATLRHGIPERLPEAIEALMAAGKPLPWQDGPPPTAAPAAEPVQPLAPEGPPGKTSLYLLVAANLVPLGGVLALGWTVGDIMLLFWLESAIIGLFNILKMFRIAGWPALFYSIFFIGHFGAFMSVHLLFIYSLFIESATTTSALADVTGVFVGLWPAIAALFISHLFSFRENFLARREYLLLTLKDQMHKPYARIILMHVTIIFGGFMVLALDSPILALVLLIALKTVVDAHAHRKEHTSIRKK